MRPLLRALRDPTPGAISGNYFALRGMRPFSNQVLRGDLWFIYDEPLWRTEPNRFSKPLPSLPQDDDTVDDLYVRTVPTVIRSSNTCLTRRLVRCSFISAPALENTILNDHEQF